MNRASKLIHVEDLPALGELLRQLGYSIVWTNGCFDLLHAGHCHSLWMAAGLGDRLVVGVNSDDSVKRLKGPSRPIESQEVRARQLCEVFAVHYVVVFDDDAPERCIRLLRPDVHCKGEEYRGRAIAEAAAVAECGGRIAYLPRLAGYSTTGVIEQRELRKRTVTSSG